MITALITRGLWAWSTAGKLAAAAAEAARTVECLRNWRRETAVEDEER
jgi:hypothetical protein